MAEATSTKQIRLQSHLHDVTIQFFKHAFPKSNSLPPVYLQITQESLSLASSTVSLRESPEGSGTYVACWKREVLSMVVTMEREIDNKKFQKKEVKFFLKIYSKGKTNHSILGTYALDISSLKLEMLDFASEASERKQLMFHFARKAVNTIKSVTLVATFQYEALNDESSSASRNPAMQSPLISPQLGHSQPQKKLEAIAVTYTPSSTASSESESEPIPSPSANFPYVVSLASGRKLSSKSKAKKLRGIFQVRRKKSKRQYSLRQKSVRSQQSKKRMLEFDVKPLAINPMHEESPSTLDNQDLCSLDTEFKIVKQMVYIPTKASSNSNVQSDNCSLEKLPNRFMATDESSVQKEDLLRSTGMPDESMSSHHHSTQEQSIEDTSEHRSENSAPMANKIEPTMQEHEQDKSTGDDLSPMHRIGIAVLPPALLASDTGNGNERKKAAAATAAGLIAANVSNATNSDDISSTENAENSKQETGKGAPTVAVLTPRQKSNDTKPPFLQVPRKYSDPPLPISPADQEHYRRRSHSLIPDGKIVMKVNSKGRQSPKLQSSSQQPRRMTKFSSSPSLATQSQSGHFHSTAVDTSGLFSGRKMAPSMVDLIRPVRRSLPENLHSNFQASPASESFGILKVRVTGMNRAESDHLSHQDLAELALNPEKHVMPDDQIAEPPSEGIYCALTINGGNTRAETSVQPILSNRPVIWEEPKEVLFYTKKTQQVFIMCRKTVLNNTTTKSASTSTSQTATAEDTCIGAAILPLSSLEVSTSRQISSVADIYQNLKQLKFIPMSLSLQPKGSVLLQASFYTLQPRCRVSCKGTVTVDCLLDVDCNPNHELCCSARVDEQIQGCTSVLGIEDYSNNGWMNEPMHFEAHGNYEYSIHIWAYSPDETEYWCGGCTLPLGVILPEDIKKDPTALSHCVVKESSKRMITLPVEPQGKVSLSFTIQPLSKDEMLVAEQESIETERKTNAPTDVAPSSPDSVGKTVDSTTELHSPSRKSPLRATLRKNRSTATDMRERTFAVSIRKSYVEKSLPLEQENTDLKKEVEYLREELRKTKAKLAEQQFFHEKTQLELRALQEELSKPKKNHTKVGLVKKKMKQYITS